MKNIEENRCRIIYVLYKDEEVLLKGIKILIDKGVKIKEVYTPFTIHGLDKILNLGKTSLSKMAFIYGFLGMFLSFVLTWYTMNYDWPQNIGGKPSFFWHMNVPAFVPVIFELTIFCTAHLICISYLIKCALFTGSKDQNPDTRTTDDKFMLEIIDQKISNELINFIKKSGALEITMKDL